MGEGEGNTLPLVHTPTYAVVAVVGGFVLISVAVERGIHLLGKALRRRKQKALFNALTRMKEELMLLGFLSILLSIFEPQIVSICVPFDLSNPLLPCPYTTAEKALFVPAGEALAPGPAAEGHGRRLLSSMAAGINGSRVWTPHLPDAAPSRALHRTARRLLAESMGGEVTVTPGSEGCSAGHHSFISGPGLHQLHTYIFMLAIVHILFSFVTIVIAEWRISCWKNWEDEAHKDVDEGKHLPSAWKQAPYRHTSFVNRHTRHADHPDSIRLYVACFFRQFVNSISHADYRVLRQAFVKSHNTSLKFDFHSYLLRSMEADFIHVVGISWYLWLVVIVLLLLAVQSWHILFWVSFAPLLMAVVVGTKLEHIMSQLAHETKDSSGHCLSNSIVLRDDLFWFNRPVLILNFIHYILFQWEIGTKSCFTKSYTFLIISVVLSCFVQLLCSYVTLPLYAFATQLGSKFRKELFSEDIHAPLRAWAKRNKKHKPNLLGDAAKQTVGLATSTVIGAASLGAGQVLGLSRAPKANSSAPDLTTVVEEPADQLTNHANPRSASLPNHLTDEHHRHPDDKALNGNVADLPTSRKSEGADVVPGQEHSHTLADSLPAEELAVPREVEKEYELYSDDDSD
eukprot:SM000139S00103  [mRNA]  locus=s139:120103:124600:- [translate_table: standard]